MIRLFKILIAVLLLAGSSLGCGEQSTKDVHKGKDKPRPAEREKEPEKEGIKDER